MLGRRKMEKGYSFNDIEDQKPKRWKQARFWVEIGLAALAVWCFLVGAIWTVCQVLSFIY